MCDFSFDPKKPASENQRAGVHGNCWMEAACKKYPHHELYLPQFLAVVATTDLMPAEMFSRESADFRMLSKVSHPSQRVHSRVKAHVDEARWLTQRALVLFYPD